MGVSKLVEAAVPAQNEEQQLVEELKKRHGVEKVHALAVDGKTVYVRIPTPAVWRRFRSEMQDPRRREDAQERLFRTCLLHPDQPGLDAMLLEQPGLMDTLSTTLAELSGLAGTVEKKVL